MTAIWRLRAGLLTLVGAIVVHKARYLLSPPEHGHELQGAHGYLGWLTPVAAALLLVATVQLAVWARRATPADRPELPSTRGLWFMASATLLLVFSGQETLELTAAHGQVPELGELLEHLGWQLLPLAVCVGGLLALLLRGAATVVRRLLRRPIRLRSRPARRLRPQRVTLARRGSVLALHLAGRAPPSLS